MWWLWLYFATGILSARPVARATYRKMHCEQCARNMSTYDCRTHLFLLWGLGWTPAALVTMFTLIAWPVLLFVAYIAAPAITPTQIKANITRRKYDELKRENDELERQLRERNDKR
jgi:hypothetical protein